MPVRRRRRAADGAHGLHGDVLPGRRGRLRLPRRQPRRRRPRRRCALAPSPDPNLPLCQADRALCSDGVAAQGPEEALRGREGIVTSVLGAGSRRSGSPSPSVWVGPQPDISRFMQVQPSLSPDPTITLRGRASPNPTLPAGGRKITMVYYLNGDWRPEHGGSLRVFRGASPQSASVDVSPLANRLVVFWSDSVLHQVGSPVLPFNLFSAGGGCCRRWVRVG